MIVQHVESGLGNQMLAYAEYLALKEANPNSYVCIENIIYDIEECDDVICQWNGYELETIFGLRLPNIKDEFTSSEWEDIMQEIRDTEFWKDGWNYVPAILKALQRHGLDLQFYFGEPEKRQFVSKRQKLSALIRKIFHGKISYYVKRKYKQKHAEQIIKLHNSTIKVFEKRDNVYYKMQLAFNMKNVGIERISTQLIDAFQFPKISEEDLQNRQMLELLKANESVAIHARRGDLLNSNGECYRYGYFKRAVRYIRSKVENPIFVFFCDPGSIEWCKRNYKIFDLDPQEDRIYYVNWNIGRKNYIDMQLMSQCKHAVITNSSFGWWGAYLIQNKDKITISPYEWMNTTTCL